MIINIPQQVNTAIDILEGAGYKAYVVGGAVRDALMDREPGDWDITCSALPSQVKEAFEGFRIIETGLKHGTVTVIVDGMSLEITTFRIDGGYSDNRHPDSVSFTADVQDDLSRRDFTCNAVAYSPGEGFVDPFGGIEDIKSKIIRCVGEPDVRFNEDGLRILRALRFSRVLSFDIDPATAAAVHSNVNLLNGISRERVFSELCKIITSADKSFLEEYSDIFFNIIPELRPEQGCAQNHIRHIFDVWSHTCAAVENAKEDYLIRLAVLLHDIGKPACKTEDEKGVSHFYGHGKAGAAAADEIMRRFRASNKVRNYVVSLVEYHDFVPDKISKKTYKKYLGRFGEEFIRDLFELRRADVSAQNPAFIEEALEQNRKGLEILEEIIKEESCLTVKDLAVNGNDLTGAGIVPSPEMGRILNRLFDEVISEKIPNEKSVLLSRAKELYINGNS